ncbi:plectin-like [Alosa alosa]|uniref:plectin-like n=1 Tax=Alosa alosa TaxID=278164 RepID=UPI0020154549|nr:plectin-like [Alosa alosa]
MDPLDPTVVTPILFIAAHFLTAAGVWLYRRRRARHADERDRVQKKTFTKWVNKHLIKVRKHITDLYEDLRDGHNLISLLEVLSGVTLRKGVSTMRRVCVSRAPPLILTGGEEEDGDQGNVQIALDFLKQRQVKLVNIRNDDITDGNPKLTLGLIWTIILHFQSEMMDQTLSLVTEHIIYWK